MCFLKVLSRKQRRQYLVFYITGHRQIGDSLDRWYGMRKTD